MAEYWKSTPKYWCKHCKVYVRDTAFEKTQHEATGRHQGSLKRFLKDLHRGNEQQGRENQRAKDEVQRLSSLVAGSGSGSGADQQKAEAPWKKNPSSSSSAPAAKASAADRKRQMEQLAEMGVAIPDEYRGDLSLAGDWQTISERPIETSQDDESAVKNIGVRKRKFEGQEEAEEAGEMVVRKGWGSTIRQYPGFNGGDDAELDALLGSTKGLASKKESTPDGQPDPKPEETTIEPGDSAVGDTVKPVSDAKTESDPSVPPSETNGDQDNSTGVTPGVVFKKRKSKQARK